MMHCGHCYDNHQSPYSGECPGVICQECADNREWHRAILEETCGEDEDHCACVPTLRKEIARLTAALSESQEESRVQTADKNALVTQLHSLQAATLRVVEAMWNTYKFLTADEAVDCGVSAALADPILVALGRT